MQEFPAVSYTHLDVYKRQQGVTADALDVYGKVKNYTGGETRFFTGLQLKGGEYQAAKVKEGDTTYQSSWFDGRNEVILCTVKKMCIRDSLLSPDFPIRTFFM